MHFSTHARYLFTSKYDEVVGTHNKRCKIEWPVIRQEKYNLIFFPRTNGKLHMENPGPPIIKDHEKGTYPEHALDKIENTTSPELPEWA